MFSLPASADLCQPWPQAGESQEDPAHQDGAGQDEGQQVEGGQVIRVSSGEEGKVPAEEEGVHDGKG